MLRILFVILIFAGLAAAFTVPSQQQAEEMMGTQVMAAVAAQDIKLENGAAGNALLIGCKLRPSDCMKVLKTQISSQYEDYRVFSTFSARGLGIKTWCVGAFTQFYCPGGLKSE